MIVQWLVCGSSKPRTRVRISLIAPPIKKMRLFKPYSNIEDFLARFTLLKIGPLHIRLHKITDKDRTTLYHNHPFHYISLILKGGYSESVIKDGKIEKVSHSAGSVIVRSCEAFHRIENIRKTTYTLFFAWGDYGWQAFNPTPDNSKDGLHQREISGVTVWCKREAGIWFIGNKSKQVAANETRHSIHQM